MIAASPHVAHGRSGRLRLAAVLLLAGLASTAPAADLPELVFEVALSHSSFHDVNLSDATAAYRVLLQKMGRRNGYEIKSEVTLYEDTPHFARAIQRGKIHMAVIDAWEFLDLEQLREVRPFFVPTVNGQVGRRYVVLARRESGFRTLADLCDRAIVRLDTVNNGACDHWLASLLPDDALHPPAAFIEALESVTKPTAAVLPVYFGQKAACIVDEASFNLMKELNPQVGNALEVVACSDVFVDAVICLGEQEWSSSQAKADTVDALAHVDADPAGRQVLTLFRISGLVGFQQEQLATIRALRRKVGEPKARVESIPEVLTSSSGSLAEERSQ